jgi:hypothetical protein
MRDCDSHIPVLGMIGGLHGLKGEVFKPRRPSFRIRTMLFVAKVDVMAIQWLTLTIAQLERIQCWIIVALLRREYFVAIGDRCSDLRSPKSI